ncbi:MULTISPECIES: hypothetical protein [unclassified Kitasatospora]|uniref:hypothetical protein n=1 Tax=unclassified Kitasatospora TaxID=2633591 RepID=UPI0033CC691F
MRTWTLATAWLVATVAAAAVGWLGVNTVLRAAIFGPPQALTVPDRVAAHTAPPIPDGTPTPSQSPRPSSPTAVTTPSRTAPAAVPSPRTSASATPPTSPDSTGDVHGYTVHGGQVTLALGTDSASLVSATPASGYAVTVWRAKGWLRVDFTGNGKTSSVFATWNGHPPMVQSYES